MSPKFERGVIRNKEFKRRISDFSGLRYGKITPTDLDLYVEFSGKLFVFVEAKFMNSEMEYGQKLALERLCDGMHRPAEGKHSVLFLVTHCQEEGDIDMAKTKVVKYRHGGVWKRPHREGSTLRDGIDAFKLKILGAA